MTSPSPTQLPIVDTHQHLWDLERFRLPWLAGSPTLNRSFVMEDYLQATAGLNVVRSVYMEVDVTPEQHAAEAEYVVEVCASAATPMAAAVIGGRPAAPHFGGYLDRFQGNRFIKGVRQVLHGEGTPPGYCRQPEFVRGIRLLGERGLSFDLCMRPGELADAAWLVDACPETRFILDHCGNPEIQSPERSTWEASIASLAQRPNVVAKVSGIVAAARPGSWQPEDLAPFVQHVLREFGADRVMFGGDWPVCTLTATFRQWVEALRRIVSDRPEAEQRQLFAENAIRFYGLEGTEGRRQ